MDRIAFVAHEHSTHAETEHHIKMNDTKIYKKVDKFKRNMLGLCIEVIPGDDLEVSLKQVEDAYEEALSRQNH